MEARKVTTAFRFPRMPSQNLPRLACVILLSACAVPNPSVSRTTPASGLELLQRMHDA